jgi:Lrp/AsnC family transcriptional regulator, regulator of ectoine-degradation genes
MTMKLDKFDIKILEVLQTDGRLPIAQLAERVGLTTSPTWGRVRQLEEAGVLRGYHADVAMERLAQVTVVIVTITLENHRAHDLHRFETGVAAIPEIIECSAVTGAVDYVLKFVVPTVEDYQRIIDGMLNAELGIQRYWSHIVTKLAKPFAGVPVARLIAGRGEA